MLLPAKEQSKTNIAKSAVIVTSECVELSGSCCLKATGVASGLAKAECWSVCVCVCFRSQPECVGVCVCACLQLN